ncbi:MAG TPA: PP2C family protein-serine/threonine phosphatase, partial [Verrucomicrobiae bacterium]|nr:PP2C family protein-serine/threonine phosphatase [Verrucomicrobiae bacterium]
RDWMMRATASKGGSLGPAVALGESPDVSPLLEHPGLALTLPALGPDSELANELAIARTIQQSLLPKSFPTLPGFGLAGFCQSAREIGGDFYDAMLLGEGSLLLVVADVMGKGVPAALFAASLRMLIRSMAERASSPAELLQRINRQLYPELSSVDMFITAQLVLADTRRGVLEIASAGHCPFLLTDSLGQIQAVAPPGLPLGIQQTAAFEQEEISLEDCRCALVYTDGLTESSDTRGNLFGLERLETWLAGTAERKQTATQLRDEFLDGLARFQAGTTPRDDLTLIILARDPSSAVANLAHQKARPSGQGTEIFLAG